ncbi:MAG: methyltransferase [Oceanospirillaceae bacterium]|uniref:MGMT family protein n=1 Tax=unclassified Thalassolituus TaxID=2624967 RepID=UPI000C0B6283|nr:MULTISPECIES: MGMT family protein [unclassified Thalassolituus]MAK90009.1 methyltransferase [Thalassolituus sp.]MAS25631.1 methyltransferase [Oceanospirillaceae bacterium]MAX98783.1 methyltransferase [Oceanospirillaceae bacterium]MBS52220.1 methyltransferase [Oceanospirillaceae bacterium]|tara:strand:+ start:117 stop:452 length:336 start_codon:yes stop_codon:yes gene_type:complete
MTDSTNAQTDARQRLYTALAGIPAGYVITYGQLAALAGFSRRARWAGQVLKQLPQDSRLPWHRVINAQGKISLPGDAGEKQRALLESEGVTVSDSLRIDLSLFSWQKADTE